MQSEQSKLNKQIVEDLCAAAGCTVSEVNGTVGKYVEVKPPQGKTFDGAPHILLDWYDQTEAKYWLKQLS